ncbi:MAG: FAD-dependent oxidoreductase, partial [Candidatus Sulfotelmatobacter sp.]
MSQIPTPQSVAIAGGGLAGLAAACALADSGFRVTLFERRPYL